MSAIYEVQRKKLDPRSLPTKIKKSFFSYYIFEMIRSLSPGFLSRTVVQITIDYTAFDSDKVSKSLPYLIANNLIF